jgi:DNA (cytosine-5)-methyltransferase 1
MTAPQTPFRAGNPGSVLPAYRAGDGAATPLGCPTKDAGGFLPKLRVLDLFSGIGGFSLGLERTGGFETVAFCEIEEFPRRILAKHWPGTPIHRDVRELKGADVGPVDVICGGYPCQPFSFAGVRRGAEDDRHLWPEYRRLIQELGPTWVIGENVAGHISMGLDDVLSDLEALGYACRAFVIPACAVNAPHRRDRIWIIGHTDRDGKPACAKHGEASVVPSLAGHAADAERIRLPGSGRTVNASDKPQEGQGEADQPFYALGWPTESPVRGADDGFPPKLDAARLKALGNAVVPAIPELIGRAILQAQSSS